VCWSVISHRTFGEVTVIDTRSGQIKRDRVRRPTVTAHPGGECLTDRPGKGNQYMTDETPEQSDCGPRSDRSPDTARRRFLTALGSSAALLAGCSGDGDSSSPGDAADATDSTDTAGAADSTDTAGATDPTDTIRSTATPVPTATPMPDYHTAYVGTFTGEDSEGVYRCRVDGETGGTELAGSVDPGENPSFLALSPDGDRLYAVNEVDPGTVTAMAVDDSGALSVLNTVENGGEGPAHVSIDATGSYLLVSDYHGGVLSVIPVTDDGRLAEPSQVIDHGDGANVHSVLPGPDNEVAYVAALGTDEFFVYDMDLEAGRLEEKQRIDVESGAGPRHADVHPDGSVVYVLCERNSTLLAFDRSADGTLSQVASVDTLPPEFDGENYTAEVRVHQSGEFLYVSNRGYDSIARFDLQDPERPELVDQTDSGGEWPRHFTTGPDGDFLFVANQQSDDLHTFRIGGEGSLEPTGDVLGIPQPVCVVFAD
jgi:6-phosphogluconolactonase